MYENIRVYMPQSTNSLDDSMVYGPTHKLGIIRDTSIQPFTPKVERFEAAVPDGGGKVKVLVGLSYQLRPGDIYPIHQKSLKINRDRASEGRTQTTTQEFAK